MRLLKKCRLRVVEKLPGLFSESIKASVTGSAIADIYLFRPWPCIVRRVGSKGRGKLGRSHFTKLQKYYYGARKARAAHSPYKQEKSGAMFFAAALVTSPTSRRTAQSTVLGGATPRPLRRGGWWGGLGRDAEPMIYRQLRSQIKPCRGAFCEVEGRCDAMHIS
jgi:hypothetical protein